MLQTKALYNLLRLNAAEDPSVEAEPWAVEDLRVVSNEALFARMQQHKVQIDQKALLQFAAECDTPEELTDLLLVDEESEARDPFYLLVFELWRRFVPEKQSLSIFCDELDQRIEWYDQGSLDSDELIQDALANLLEVFDDNADAGVDSTEIWMAVADYCAHDLEQFLFDDITDLLDEGNSLYASELIEGFSPYVPDPIPFDFLRLRLLSLTDIGDVNLAMHRLLENELELPLLLEILRFLADGGLSTGTSIFKMALQKTFPLLSSQEELSEVIQRVADFYRRLNEDEKERAVQNILNNKRTGPICVADLQTLQQMIAE